MGLSLMFLVALQFIWRTRNDLIHGGISRLNLMKLIKDIHHYSMVVEGTLGSLMNMTTSEIRSGDKFVMTTVDEQYHHYGRMF